MELFSNIHLWAAVSAWLCAELIKIVFHLIVEHKLRLSLLIASGGMPSSHASVVCALCTTIAMTEPQHLASPLFAFACVFAYIVMYDAAGVRRAAGEQAKVLNRIQAEKTDPSQQLKELLGHTPLQVACGAALGILIGFAVGLISGVFPY